MTTLRSDGQLQSADRDSLGYLRVALNRHDVGGTRVMFKEPDCLADYEWPPVELVLDHYEACFVWRPLRRCACSDCVDRLRVDQFATPFAEGTASGFVVGISAAYF